MTHDPVRQLRTRIPPGIMPPMPVPQSGRQDDLTEAMWGGYTPVERIQAKPSIDRTLYRVPTMEQGPESVPPNDHTWFNANCPPWVCPPFWSKPIDSTFSRCIPAYEQSTLLYFDGDTTKTSFNVGQDYVLIIRAISYEALNAAQGDVFQFDFLVDGNAQIQIEDMNIDAAQANPAHRFALAGNTRQMPVHLVVDRNHTLAIRATVRGPINLAGNSPYFPGQPITTGDCHMRVYLQGWLANLRDNMDGAPRPTDLGDAGGMLL